MALPRQRPPHRLEWPWTASQVESADEQFFELYKRLSAVERVLATTGGPGFPSMSSPSTVIGASASALVIGACCEAEAWPLLVVPTPVLYTPGSVLFAGASGAPSENNAKFFWDLSNARLGLGIATPNSLLQLFAGTTTGLTIDTDNDSPYSLRIQNRTVATNYSASLNIYQSNDGVIHFNKGNTDRFVITAAGVGFAVSATNFALEVGAMSAGNCILLSNLSLTGHQGWQMYLQTNGSDTDLHFFESKPVGSAERVILQAGGNVGIGTTTPGALLDVSGITRAQVYSSPATGGAATAGQATLVGGTVTVNTTAMTATALLFLQYHTAGGTIGTSLTYTQVNGVSFTVTSSNALDTSIVNWHIIETH